MTEAALSRTELLIGAQGLERLREARVCVIGLGGVGSYAVEALVRAGIQHFTLIDFDKVGESNLNRQIIALQHTIGQPKVEVTRDRILGVNPHAKVLCHQVFLDETNRPTLLMDNDFYIDAIDSLGPKIGLLEHAVLQGLNIVTVMGAGNRLDPGSVRISPLHKTHNCPLARRVRKSLGKRGIRAQIPCVWSAEKPLLPENDDDLPDDEPGQQRGRKRRTVGSISYLPAIMGMHAAAWVINSILDNIE